MRRALAEPAFAAEVEMWRDHFAQLFADWPEIAAPTESFESIERMINRGDAPVTALRRGPWPWVAGLATLVAACLAVLLIMRPGPAPVAPPPSAPAATAPAHVLIAQLTPAEKTAGLEPVAAIYDPAIGAMRIAPGAFAKADKDAELWVIPADGTPRPMGVLRKGDATALPIDTAAAVLLRQGVTLAVSIEPIGGSPTGKPTGPVVATGTLSFV
ncbi:anti-sigma factor [Sphingomonas koreensis]|nr:anti-sigma factor [Sphingomonas koreensis]